MRIGLIGVSQETDTFNPSPTTREHFEAFGIERGDSVLARRDGGSVGGYAAAADAHGDVQTVAIFNARAVAGGRLSADTLQWITDEVRDGLAAAGKLDGLALQLHGACSAEGVDDVDGYLLGVAREVVGEDVPIVMALDHHANMTQAMVDGCEALVAHRTQPHDVVDTGQQAAELLFRVVAGEVSPTAAWRKIPMITHQEQFLTSRHPMKTWFDRAREMEAAGQAVTISTFPMQPWLDVDDGGWAVVVYTDADPEQAERLADELADLAWSMRDELMECTSVPAAAAVAEAMAGSGLVILSDTGDSVLGGAGGDSTVILSELLASGSGPALVPVVDPQIGTKLTADQVGGEVSVDIGGAVAGMHQPVRVSGTLASFGPYTLHLDDGFISPEIDLGVHAVIHIAAGAVVVTQRPGVGGVYPAFYRQLGIDPADYRMVVVKTASNFQHFLPIASGVIRVDTPGPTQSDIAGLPWKRIPRPMFPLDEIPEWSASQ